MVTCPRLPAGRKRLKIMKHITESERYQIEGFKKIKMSNRKIAKALGKSHTAIPACRQAGMKK
jgi:hypothetical protein